MTLKVQHIAALLTYYGAANAEQKIKEGDAIK
jgi:hypothetical protein